jgi:hypothetical protein
MSKNNDPSRQPLNANADPNYKRRREIVGTAAGLILVAGITGGVKLMDVITGSPGDPIPTAVANPVYSPVEGHQIVVKKTSGPDEILNVTIETDKPGATISKAVADVAEAEGLSLNSPNVINGINNAQNEIKTATSADMVGDSFEIEADRPIVDPSAMNNDPNLKFVEVISSTSTSSHQ